MMVAWTVELMVAEKVVMMDAMKVGGWVNSRVEW